MIQGLAVILGILSFLLGCWISHLLLKLWDKKRSKQAERRARQAELTDFSHPPVFAHNIDTPSSSPPWLPLVIRHIETKGWSVSGEGPWILTLPKGGTIKCDTAEELKRVFEERERLDSWSVD